MKYLVDFKGHRTNEAAGAPTATGSTSPIVVLAYDATSSNEALYKKLMWGGTNEVSQDIKRLPNYTFQVDRTCAQDAKANYSVKLKDGQATAGVNQARLNPAAFHADINLKYTYKVSALTPKVGEHALLGIWVIDVASNQPLATEGTILNTGKVLSQFQQGGKPAGKFVAAKGTEVTFEARSAVFHIVYAPAAGSTPPAAVVEPKKYVFRDTFEYNSTQVNLTTPEAKKSLTQLLSDLKSGFKYKLVAHGNASQVPTTYQGGNEKLSKDRAVAMGTAIKAAAVAAGIKWETVVVATEATAAVTGPAWDKSADKKIYTEHQYVSVQLVPQDGQKQAVPAAPAVAQAAPAVAKQ